MHPKKTLSVGINPQNLDKNDIVKMLQSQIEDLNKANTIYKMDKR